MSLRFPFPQVINCQSNHLTKRIVLNLMRTCSPWLYKYDLTSLAGMTVICGQILKQINGGHSSNCYQAEVIKSIYFINKFQPTVGYDLCVTGIIFI